jgi:DNA-binding NarL/FixJ family response regulator
MRGGIIDCVNRSVLVVDDDPEFRALAARLLAASGLTVVGEADSISAALSAADRLKPSAVLVDAELQDGDGIGLARDLASLPWRPRVVLVSIDPDIATTDNARRAGAEAFLNKVELATAPLAQLLGDQ